jgi:hypothetical protein
LAESPRQARLTLLAALCHARTSEITDSLIKLLMAERAVFTSKVRTVLRGSYSLGIKMDR